MWAWRATVGSKGTANSEAKALRLAGASSSPPGQILTLPHHGTPAVTPAPPSLGWSVLQGARQQTEPQCQPPSPSRSILPGDSESPAAELGSSIPGLPEL